MLPVVHVAMQKNIWNRRRVQQAVQLYLSLFEEKKLMVQSKFAF